MITCQLISNQFFQEPRQHYSAQVHQALSGHTHVHVLVIAWYKRFIALLLKLPVGRGACKIFEQMVAYGHYGGQLVLRRSVVLHVGLAIQGDKGRGTSSPRTRGEFMGEVLHGHLFPFQLAMQVLNKNYNPCNATFHHRLRPF